MGKAFLATSVPPCLHKRVSFPATFGACMRSYVLMRASIVAVCLVLEAIAPGTLWYVFAFYLNRSNVLFSHGSVLTRIFSIFLQQLANSVVVGLRISWCVSLIVFRCVFANPTDRAQESASISMRSLWVSISGEDSFGSAHSHRARRRASVSL